MRFLHTDEDPRLEKLKGRGCYPLSLASLYDRDPVELIELSGSTLEGWKGTPKEIVRMSLVTHASDLIPFSFKVVDTALKMVMTHKIVGAHVAQLATQAPAPMGRGLLVCTMGLHQVGHVAAYEDGMFYDPNEPGPVPFKTWLKNMFHRDLATYVAFQYNPPSLNGGKGSVVAYE